MSSDLKKSRGNGKCQLMLTIQEQQQYTMSLAYAKKLKC